MTRAFPATYAAVTQRFHTRPRFSGPAAARVLLLMSVLLTGRVLPGGAQVRINYQDAELTTVIAALADMAGLNVVFVGAEPSTRVTLKMGRPISPAAIPGLLRTILEGAGLVAVERDGVLQVIGSEQARMQGETQVFVHALRHATAAEMAVTLAAVYGSGDAAQAAGFLPPGRRSLSQELRGQRSAGVVAVPGAVVFGSERPMGRAPLQLEADQQPGIVGGIMVGEAVVVPYTPTNSLIVRTTPRNFEMLRATIERLDARPKQVLIEVFVAELTLDSETEFGIDWTALFGRGDVRSLRRVNTLPDSAAGGLLVQLLALGTHVDVRATLRALSARARVNVLATPSVLARNNEEARILVGSQVPFTQIARSGLSGEVLDRVIQFRDVGTELAIVPTINQNGYITLQVLQQVSTLTNQTLFEAPVITVREAQTSAVVRDRQTIVIGGLIDSEEARIRRGIPLLKDIPFLGALFGDTELRNRKTELVIFLTPYLVDADEEADVLREQIIDRARNGERMRREIERQQLLPRLPALPERTDTTVVAPDSIAVPVRPLPGGAVQPRR